MITPAVRRELIWVCVVLVAGFLITFTTIKAYRARGHQPVFYQQNFGPAVMMACGYGFTQPPYASTPPSLLAFLRIERDDFNCGDLPQPMPTEPVSWNGTWYYLYGTTALVWKVGGLSWLALDWLAGVFGSVTLAALYGLFRLLAPAFVAAGFAVLSMLAPAHLDQMPMLRDYSKAPFVLVSVLTLAWLVTRPMTFRVTIGMAALFGAIVGIGYGFRSDLIVMVPFGVIIVLLFLPGTLRVEWRRNVTAAAAMLVAFVVAGYPPLKGQQTGGCQFHYGLLGLTTPLVHALGLENPIYAFGDHLSDTFVDLKTGDRANRVVNLGVPILCAPDYDRASADLYFDIARTFPADLAVHAYASVETILRAGMTLPRLGGRLGSTPILGRVVAFIDRLTASLMRFGPWFTAGAVVVAWAASPRLGLALAVFVLFLAGYPAIQFDGRHWFHLRFIPIWSAVLIAGAWWRTRGQRDWFAVGTGVLGTVALLLLMVASLWALRLIQRGSASALVESYLAAPTEPLAFTAGESSLDVDWRPIDYGLPPGHRASDMLVLAIAPEGCGHPGPVDVRIRYEAPLRPHDMSSSVTVHRGRPGSSPTRLFVPVFSQGHLDQSYMRFTGVETPGRPADCIREVARFADRRAVPLWIQAQVPPGWQSLPLYQRFALRPFFH